MNDIYYRLPVELWVKIVDCSNEITLLVTNKIFFELIVLINIKVDIIEYIVSNNDLYLIKYVLLLKNNNHNIFDKLVITIDSLNKQLVKSCKKSNLTMIKYLTDLGADITSKNNYAVR